jgi:3'(2'), 5'-bisphosphate nucleotidase
MSPLKTMIDAAIVAGDVICEVYDRDIVAAVKGDGSPVTEADGRAEAVILEHLRSTGIPVLAEESAAEGRIPVLGERFFVVDPLDGTKEFIKRNGEFTVNIALCEAGRPVAGVVLVPATGAVYWGSSEGAFEAQVTDGVVGPANRLSVDCTQSYKIVASRSHGHPALAELMQSFGITDNVSVGSSLKFCLVARGVAQLYPRFTPTMEWDTAAGQAVLEAAGGVVLTLDGAPLRYGKVETGFLNPFFIAGAEDGLAQRAAAKMTALLSEPPGTATGH